MLYLKFNTNGHTIENIAVLNIIVLRTNLSPWLVLTLCYKNWVIDMVTVGLHTVTITVALLWNIYIYIYIYIYIIYVNCCAVDIATIDL